MLTFSVGTANIYGTATGLNIYAAYRQPSGLSGAAVDEPTLSGPLAGHLPAAGTPSNLDATSTAPTGPGPNDTTSLTFTPQGGTSVTTFGTSGGVYGVGIEPFNFNNQGGVPATYVPYPVPMFDPASDANALIPWGGPPGFDPDGTGEGVRDGNRYPGGVIGVSEGINVLYGVTPVAASPYTLSLTIPATSVAPTTASASATIANAGLLLPVVPPPTPTYNGSGAVAFTPTFPAGVTEEYIQVVDTGPAGAGNGGMGCNAAGGSGGNVYYTLVVKPSTTLPVSITNANAPNGTPAAICTAAQNSAAANANNTTGGALPGDTFTVQVMGFDYDLYAAAYPASAKTASPTVPAQVDISISAPATNTSP